MKVGLRYHHQRGHGSTHRTMECGGIVGTQAVQVRGKLRLMAAAIVALGVGGACSLSATDNAADPSLRDPTTSLLAQSPGDLRDLGNSAAPDGDELSANSLNDSLSTAAPAGGLADESPTPPTLSRAGREAVEAGQQPSSAADTAAPASVTSTTLEAPAEDPAEPATEEEMVAGETESLSLLNGLRSEENVTDLARDEEMAAFARDWSRQMAESGELTHSTGPYGENIAYTTNTRLSAAEAAELFHGLWIESEAHFTNMTNGEYTKAGIGLYRTENGWYGTHVFSW